MRLQPAGVLLAIIIIAATAPVDGQTTTRSEEVFGLLQFSFSNPGARSLRLGGAFNAIADDATAAYSNPAGLIEISSPEVSVEGKSANYVTVFPDHGHVLGEPTGIGADNIAGLQVGRARETVTGASFASLVVPPKRWRRRSSFAIYRHELANFRSSFETKGVFIGDTSLSRALPAQTTIEATLVAYAVAGAWRILDDTGDRYRLSVGVSLGRTALALSSTTHRYGFSPFFGPRSDLLYTNVADGSSASLSGSVGLLWRQKLSGSRYLRLGAVYRHGPAFNVAVHTIGAPGSPFDGVRETARAVLHVPGVIGFGAALETESSKLSLDINRVGYEQLFQDLANTFEVENGIEIRVGAERIIQFVDRGGKPRFFVIGVGAWRDPDHQLAYKDPTAPESQIFRRGKHDIHFAGGISVPITKHVTVDAGFDQADRQRIFSMSAVVRLPPMSRVLSNQ